MDTNIILVEDLTKKIKQQTIVDHLNFNVGNGDIYGLLGPNGAGKSTTIKMILGLVSPTSGRVQIYGNDISIEKNKILDKMGAMIEAPCFYDYMSGYKNLEIYINLYNLPKTRINEVMTLVGLEKAANKKVSQYSLGMKQRLAIARAFINDPEIVILDEPTNGLDPIGVVEIRNLIKKLSQVNKKTFIISSHNLSEIQEMCDKVAIINKGKLVAQGEVSDLLESKYDEYIIKVKSALEVKSILEKLMIVRYIEINNNEIHVQIDKGTIGIINKELINNNIEIQSISKTERNLESFFLSVL
ncbi:ABC transporter ATP-binding protein [Anaerocolumna sp.]|uniref:ABC transporter ATP-binding protein n=1 Tax=Anaerocolumna sp. TaxID=2041569 RepID=UPI0028ABB690|nr:ABC transporter ATP-binding protein [Anaerocolumna sp.]